MKKLALPSMALVVLSIGCIPALINDPINQQLYDKYLTRTFNHSKDKCFDATLAALKELDIGVEKQDRTSGLITTEKSNFLKVVEVSGNEYYASGQTFMATHKYYLQVVGDDKSATVKAVRYRLWKNAVEQTEMNGSWTKENVWDPFFAVINEKLEGD